MAHLRQIKHTVRLAIMHDVVGDKMLCDLRVVHQELQAATAEKPTANEGNVATQGSAVPTLQSSCTHDNVIQVLIEGGPLRTTFTYALGTVSVSHCTNSCKCASTMMPPDTNIVNMYVDAKCRCMVITVAQNDSGSTDVHMNLVKPQFNVAHIFPTCTMVHAFFYHLLGEPVLSVFDISILRGRALTDKDILLDRIPILHELMQAQTCASNIKFHHVGEEGANVQFLRQHRAEFAGCRIVRMPQMLQHGVNTMLCVQE